MTAQHQVKHKLSTHFEFHSTCSILCVVVVVVVVVRLRIFQHNVMAALIRKYYQHAHKTALSLNQTSSDSHHARVMNFPRQLVEPVQRSFSRRAATHAFL